MFCMLKKKNIYPAYVSKYNSNYEKQVILLMIPNVKGWRCLAVKKLSALKYYNLINIKNLIKQHLLFM